MIWKHHNQKLQRNPWHLEEELHNIYSNKTSKLQYKQSNQLFRPHHNDCKTRKGKHKCIPNKDQHRTPANNGRYIEQQQNHRLRKYNSLSLIPFSPVVIAIFKCVGVFLHVTRHHKYFQACYFLINSFRR